MMVSLHEIALAILLLNSLDDPSWAEREKATKRLTVSALSQHLFVELSQHATSPETRRRCALIAHAKTPSPSVCLLADSKYYCVPWVDQLGVSWEHWGVWLTLGRRDATVSGLTPGPTSAWVEYRIATRYYLLSLLLQGTPAGIIDLVIAQGWAAEDNWWLTRMQQ